MTETRSKNSSRRSTFRVLLRVTTSVGVLLLLPLGVLGEDHSPPEAEFIWPAVDADGNESREINQDHSEYEGYEEDHYHAGIDIARSGDGDNIVRAAAAGKIDGVRVDGDGDGGFGNALIIDHENGLYTMYAHLEEFDDVVWPPNDENFKASDLEGFEVNSGQTLGVMGETGGSATGVHLHFEIRTFSAPFDHGWGNPYRLNVPDRYGYIDPMFYLDGDYSAESPVFELDLRGDVGGVHVSGRVLDASAQDGLSGAEALLAGQSRITDADGAYSFSSVALGDSATLTVSKAGYLGDSLSLSASQAQRAITVRDVLLTPQGATAAPVISSAGLSLDGYFVERWAEEIEATARVNWNGNEPGEVRFLANGTEMDSQTGDLDAYSAAFVPDDWFSPSLRQRANVLRIVAESAQGVESSPAELPITLLPLPAFLVPPGATVGSTGDLEDHFLSPLLSNRLQIRSRVPPEGGLHDFVTLPILGEFGFSFHADGTFDYHVPTGEWTLDISGGDTGLKLGDFDAGISLDSSADGDVELGEGLVFDDLLLDAGISLDGQFELARFGVLDLFGPGASSALSKIPGLERALRTVSILILVKPELEGNASFEVIPEWNFREAQLNGTLPLEAAYEPDIYVADARVYVGGEPSVKAGLPGNLLKEFSFRAYAGITASAWIGRRRELVALEHPFVDKTFPDEGEREALIAGALGDDDGMVVAPAEENEETSWKPMDRSYLDRGGEQFLHGENRVKGQSVPPQADPAEKLEIFGRMGETPSRNQPTANALSAETLAQSDLPAQTVLPLVENVFPNASPTLAGHNEELMLLYARDNGAEGTMHFTEIAWTYFDGEAWSEPTSVTGPESGAQFNPAVAFDGAGKAMAVWEQFKDPDYEPDGDTLDMNELAGQVEIAWSTWDPSTNEWSPARLMTQNDYLDRRPRLAGPLGNGDLIMTWVDNSANQMAGSDGAESRVWWTRWDSAQENWSAPELALDELAYENSLSLAAAGDRAALAWSRSSGGDAADSDSEVFYSIYDTEDDAWREPLQPIDGPNVANRNVRAAVAEDETIYLAWRRGDDLVFSSNPALPAEAIRSGEADSLGFADFVLTLGPAGNLLVIWQEMAEGGSTTFYRVFDPASGTWGEDQLLLEGAGLEKKFSPVWDAAGNLTLAYQHVEIVDEDKSIEVEGGEVIEFTGVPQPGRNDLRVAKRAIIRDLAVQEGGLQMEVDEVFAGEQAILRGTLENSGNVAIEGLEAGFYLGDPEQGGELIAMPNISEELRAGEEKTIETEWTIPVGRSEVYFVVDPDDKVTEFDPDNNVSVMEVGGVDLSVTLLRRSVKEDGSLRFVLQVQNVGTESAPVTQVEVFSEQPADSSAGPLAASRVSRLAPGEALELAVDLPEGTQASPEKSYYLSVDEAGLLGEVDRSNSSFETSVSLWIDEDGDGLPKWWEAANGLSDTDPADGQQDRDSDGFTDAEEYLAGTNPLDKMEAPGDLDSDGLVTVLDVVAIHAAINPQDNRISRERFRRADLDFDGNLDREDAELMLELVFSETGL